jgi:transposase
VINHWKADFVQNASKLFQADGRLTAEQTRIAELERLVGRLTLQLEIAKKTSSLLSARRRKNEL